MPNEYGLDTDYFIRLCAREFNPDVIRNQRPEDLARALARAARTACAEVLQEREFLPESPAGAVGVTAVAATRKNDDGELYLDWLLEGGICELEHPGVVLIVADDANLTGDDGHGQVYTVPQPAPVVLEGWREFIADCATTAGNMVNGNRLSARAAELLADAPAQGQQVEPLYITHRPLIRNAIGLLGMRRPVAPDVERVIDGLEAMLAGQPTPADKPSAEWLYVAELAAGPAEDAAGSASVQAMLGSALKRLTFAARTSGGMAGPDPELIAACEQAERAMSFVGIGQAYMAGVNSLSNAAQDVLAERNRQINAEGWTPAHDDLYCAAELPRAAAAYILNGANDEAPAIWPFASKWWKPRDARSNYVRAGALMLAEVERLDRAATANQEQQP